MVEACRTALDRRFEVPATAPKAASSAAVERMFNDVVEALESAGFDDPERAAAGFGLAIETLLEPRTEIPDNWLA